MNECIGCPVFEDGFRSKEMCSMCDLYVLSVYRDIKVVKEK